MIEVLKYNLPDIDILYESETLITGESQTKATIWQPDKTYIILGVSNKPETSLNVENVIQDNITVYKRPSGGEAVVISADTIIISAVEGQLTMDHSLQTSASNATSSNSYNKPKEYFVKFNKKIIVALEELGVKNLLYKGISDIAIDNKKLSGSAIYRTRDSIFFHCVLNVSESTQIFERYLKHPQREPDYRKNRNHGEFVTSLKEQGYDIGFDKLIPVLKKHYN